MLYSDIGEKLCRKRFRSGTRVGSVTGPQGTQLVKPLASKPFITATLAHGRPRNMARWPLELVILDHRTSIRKRRQKE